MKKYEISRGTWNIYGGSMKRILLSSTLLLLGFVTLPGQYLSQIGYKIKAGLPQYDSYVVLAGANQTDRVLSEAKSAQLILKKSFTVYSVTYLGDMKRLITDIIKKKNNFLVIIIADEEFMNQTTVRWVSQQLTPAGIPLVTTRQNDTMCGALLTVSQQESEIKTHLNKIILSLLKLTLPEEFEKTCSVDVE